MITKNTGGPAFPRPYSQVQPGSIDMDIQDQEGMTLRDYFAAKAMQGIVTDPSWKGHTDKTCAEMAYEVADAMLAARDAS